MVEDDSNRTNNNSYSNDTTDESLKKRPRVMEFMSNADVADDEQGNLKKRKQENKSGTQMLLDIKLL
jgi:hypothetical protein